MNHQQLQLRMIGTTLVTLFLVGCGQASSTPAIASITITPLLALTPATAPVMVTPLLAATPATTAVATPTIIKVSDLPEISAPPPIAAKSVVHQGALEIRLIGNDAIWDPEKHGFPKVYVIPYDTYQKAEGGKLLEDYAIATKPPMVIVGMEPGKYAIGIHTCFEPQIDGLNINVARPDLFYAWDGWEENPTLDVRQNAVCYCTWYLAMVEENRTALVVGIRLKDQDSSRRLSDQAPRRPPYEFSNQILGQDAEKIRQTLERYGKAFTNKDSVLSLTYIDGGLHHSLRGPLAEKELKAFEQRLLTEMTSLPLAPIRVPSPLPSASSTGPNRPPTEANTKAIFPPFQTPLSGPNEVRIVNPNPFAVSCGLRIGNRGIDFDIPSRGQNSIYVPDGEYEIYLAYSNQPGALFQGDNFTLSGSFSKFVWGSGIARNGSKEYNLQHRMTQEYGDVWTHTPISTDLYN